MDSTLCPGAVLWSPGPLSPLACSGFDPDYGALWAVDTHTPGMASARHTAHQLLHRARVPRLLGLRAGRGRWCLGCPRVVSQPARRSVTAADAQHRSGEQPQRTSRACACVLSLSDSVSPWTAARQAPLSTGFSRQEHWSGLPLPPPGDLPHPGMEPMSPALAGGFSTTEPPGKPLRTAQWVLSLSL